MNTAQIIATITGSLVGLVIFSYCFCFRRQIAERNTKKMMDQINHMHPQEPQGEISTEVLPDGSLGLTVRPLPAAPRIAQMSSNGANIPLYTGSQALQQPDYRHQQPQLQQQLLYTQGQQLPSAAPIAVAESQQDLQQQLGLSTHPRPGVVTTAGLYSGTTVQNDEIKGHDEMPWDPRPFAPPSAPTLNSVAPSAVSSAVFRIPGYGSEEASASISSSSFSLPPLSLSQSGHEYRQPQDHQSGVNSISSRVGADCTSVCAASGPYNYDFNAYSGGS